MTLSLYVSCVSMSRDVAMSRDVRLPVNRSRPWNSVPCVGRTSLERSSLDSRMYGTKCVEDGKLVDSYEGTSLGYPWTPVYSIITSSMTSRRVLCLRFSPTSRLDLSVYPRKVYLTFLKYLFWGFLVSWFLF